MVGCAIVSSPYRDSCSGATGEANVAVQRRRASAVGCNRLLAGLLPPSLARPCDYLTASALGSL